MNQQKLEDDAPVEPWLRVEGAISATARKIRQVYDLALAELGITLPESTVLAYVAEIGSVTQTQIARALDSGRAATGLRIDKLERLGAVERLSNPTDRRVWMVGITAEGHEMVKQINEIDAKLRTHLRAGVAREDRHRVVDVLQQIQLNLDEPPAL